MKFYRMISSYDTYVIEIAKWQETNVDQRSRIESKKNTRLITFI